MFSQSQALEKSLEKLKTEARGLGWTTASFLGGAAHRHPRAEELLRSPLVTAPLQYPEPEILTECLLWKRYQERPVGKFSPILGFKVWGVQCLWNQVPPYQKGFLIWEHLCQLLKLHRERERCILFKTNNIALKAHIKDCRVLSNHASIVVFLFIFSLKIKSSCWDLLEILLN